MRFIIMASALAVPVAAGAQPVESFTELGAVIELYTDTEVTLGPDNEVVTGTVLEISDTSLILLTPDGLFEFNEARIRRIRQLWDDPNRNGGVVGFALGAIPWVVLTALAWQDDGRPKGTEVFAQVAFTAASGVAGSLIGAAIDGRNRAPRELYRWEPKRHVSMSPLLSGERVGGAVTITW